MKRINSILWGIVLLAVSTVENQYTVYLNGTCIFGGVDVK